MLKLAPEKFIVGWVVRLIAFNSLVLLSLALIWFIATGQYEELQDGPSIVLIVALGWCILMLFFFRKREKKRPFENKKEQDNLKAPLNEYVAEVTRTN